MPRKGPAPRRDLMPDPVYRSVVVTQVVNKILQEGKRSIAEKIVYDALADIEKRSGGDPVAVLEARGRERPARHSRCAAAASVVPPTRCRSRCVRVARPPSPSAGSSGTPASGVRRRMAERLANELMDASNGIGASIKRKDDLQKMAESNKAFAHYRW